MGFRQLTFLFFLLTISFEYCYSQEVVVKRSSVIELYKGKPCYIHFVSAGETVQSIAKAYGISSDELVSENPVLSKGAKADMVLRIPQRSAVVVPEADAPKAERPKEIIRETPRETSKPAVKEPVKSAETSKDYVLYEVKKQETLYGISRDNGISVEELVAANPGLEVLQDGMQIRIPKKGAIKLPVKDVQTEKPAQAVAGPGEILVNTGETLYSIAKANNTTIDFLIENNPQLSGGLKAGMILKLTKDVSVNQFAEKSYSDHLATEYKVALLLPLGLENADDILEASDQKNPADFEELNYFQFYAGFMLAADSLQQYGLKANISVADADKLNDTLVIRQALRKPGLDKVNLIVGPVYATSFTIASRFARKNNIPLVNPLSKRENITDENPFVIKVQPSGPAIAAKLAAYISAHYPHANVVAVRYDKKDFASAADRFGELFKSTDPEKTFKGTYHETLYTADQMAGVVKKLESGRQNIVVFFTNNKTVVPNFISLLSPHAKSNDLILIGMDGWDEMDLETEFLVNMNFHQVVNGSIDYESPQVEQFITRYKNKYGASPIASRHAFLGYDIGWHFLTALMLNGTGFMNSLPGYHTEGLQYRLDFSADGKNSGISNQQVDIVKLVDYKWVKAE